jgi:hypothetical protein
MTGWILDHHGRTLWLPLEETVTAKFSLRRSVGTLRLANPPSAHLRPAVFKKSPI